MTVEQLRKDIKPLQKELIKFTLIGITAVLTDLGCYYVLLNSLPERVFQVINNEDFAKGVSFLCGIFVTYNLNKYWTWKQSGRSKKRVAKFAALYGISLGLNVTANSVLLFILHQSPYLNKLPYKYFIAFVGATGASSVLNFIGQKFWVFSNPK